MVHTCHRGQIVVPICHRGQIVVTTSCQVRLSDFTWYRNLLHFSLEVRTWSRSLRGSERGPHLPQRTERGHYLPQTTDCGHHQLQRTEEGHCLLQRSERGVYLPQSWSQRTPCGTASAKASQELDGSGTKFDVSVTTTRTTCTGIQSLSHIQLVYKHFLVLNKLQFRSQRRSRAGCHLRTSIAGTGSSPEEQLVIHKAAACHPQGNSL